MLIKTKYIDCASKSVFNTWRLPTSAADTSGDIYWSAIVYIKDTGEVWTHGKLYGGFFSNVDSNKVSLTIGGTTKILALDGHVHPYTSLTGSGSTANQAILSTGVANKWVLRTLGKNAFSNVDYLPADAAAEKVARALTFQYNGNNIHSFDGSVDRVLNIIQGNNVIITGDSQGNVTIAANTGSNTVNTAGATNLINRKLFLVGAESQTIAPQTYTNSKVYIGTDNKLYSDGKVVSTEDHTHNYAGATTSGGPALKVDLNPSGLLNAIYGNYGGILQDSTNGPISGSLSNRIKILHNNSTGYYTELAQNLTGISGLWHRRNVNGTVSEWIPVIDRANFHSHLDSTYVIRGNDSNVLTNYVRYSKASGLTMNWALGNDTPTHIWGIKNNDSSNAYIFNGENIRVFANAVNRAGDTMTGALRVTEILTTEGKGLVMWNGTTYTYLGMPNGTTYIRSGETDLQHRYNGTDYKIWDARNLVGLRTEHSHNTINSIDNREIASTPQEHSAGIWLDFKTNAKSELNDGGSYTGLLTIRKHGNVSDWTGGKSAQFGFTDNSNVWVRFGSGTSWEDWKQLVTTRWADDKFLPLTGGTVTGDIILKGNTSVDMTNTNIHPRLRFDNGDSSKTVSFIFTDSTSYRVPAGIKLVGNQGDEWFEASRLIKTGSSDNHVLLGAGGHKTLVQFVHATTGNLGVQESTGTSDDISRAQFWRDNSIAAYGITMCHSDNVGYKTKIYHDYNNGGNLYMKACSNGNWGSAYTIWNSGNFDPNAKVNKAGDTMTGRLSWTMNGVTSSISNDNNTYTHYNTNANSGHWFNKSLYVSGNVYGGPHYNKILPFKEEINSQVGGSKNAQMSWSSWGTDTYGGAIQIRENGLVANTQSAWGYSPALTFYWSGRHAKRFGLRSDGQFAVDDTPISLSTHNHNSQYVTSLGTSGNYLTWIRDGIPNNLTVPYATNADTVDGFHANGLFTNLSNVGNNISITIGGTNKTLIPAYATSANSATYARKVRGEYTGNQGQQPPNYFGTNWVGFRMMNTTVGTNSQYKDWIISDCYANNDAGGAVAFGMNRQALGAYLMGSDANRTAWTRKGTFWGDWNLNPVDKKLLKKTRIPGEIVDFYVYEVNGYIANTISYSIFKNQLFDSTGRGKTSVTYRPSSFSPITYNVNLSDFVLCTAEWVSGFQGGMYTAAAGADDSYESNVGAIVGSNSKSLTGYQMPRHTHWFAHYYTGIVGTIPTATECFGPHPDNGYSPDGLQVAGYGENWHTGYSGRGDEIDFRPNTFMVFKIMYMPQSY